MDFDAQKCNMLKNYCKSLR